MNLAKFWQLSGISKSAKAPLEQCLNCGAKDLYQQSDFKRSLGLSLIVICSVSTFVLLYFGFNWFVTWSPMLVALIIDRGLSYTMPLAVLCYKCGAVHRDLSKEYVYKNFQAFDLEHHDRLHYGQEA